MQVSVWCILKEASMTNQQQEDELITLEELLEIILTTIREYKGETGILRKCDKEQE